MAFSNATTKSYIKQQSKVENSEFNVLSLCLFHKTNYKCFEIFMQYNNCPISPSIALIILNNRQNLET